jgi:hypothetical protein
MAQKDLKPLNTRTKEEQKKICIAGGKKSGEVRKQNKTMKECLILLSQGKVKKEIEDKIIEIYPHLTREDINKGLLPLIKQQEKAEEGDLQSLIFIRDTMGQKPVDKTDLTTNGESLCQPVFNIKLLENEDK